MADRTVARAARQGARTQPIQGTRAKPATIKPSPISDEELADIITQARKQRYDEDNAADQQRKAS